MYKFTNLLQSHTQLLNDLLVAELLEAWKDPTKSSRFQSFADSSIFDS